MTQYFFFTCDLTHKSKPPLTFSLLALKTHTHSYVIIPRSHCSRMYIVLGTCLITAAFFHYVIILFKKSLENISHSLPASVLSLLVSGINERSHAEHVSQLSILLLL